MNQLTTIFRRSEERISALMLEKHSLEMAKTMGLVMTIVGGAGLMGFTEPPLQYVGGAAFIGLICYPLVEVVKRIVTDWRRDALRRSLRNRV